MPERTYQFGDRVVHTGRPEWGAGVVTAAQSLSHEGVPCQRLTLRFERAGLKTVSTAFAELRPAEESLAPAAVATAPAAGPAEGEGTWLDEVEARDLPRRMAILPEETRDPFASLESRIRATLGLYRFADHGAPLLDWAAMQTGLADPMTRFSRHELEEYFRRFAHERERQLKALVAEARRADPGAVARASANAPDGARSALKRLIGAR